MTLPVMTFDQIVTAQATAMQANCPVALNLTPNPDGSSSSVILALIRANAANAIWLQALSTALLATTRLSSSSGIDVDTFINDFGFSRLMGNAAGGSLTFSRFTTTIAGLVQVGTIVATANNLQFIVLLDTSNPAYDPTQNGYVIPINTSSVTVTALCTQVGIIGNVTNGAINTIVNFALVSYVDSVTNASAFTGGVDTWSDTTTKQEFILYINSLSRATLQAIQYAVSSTPSPDGTVVKRYNVVENKNESGATQLGYFYVVIDNGLNSTASTALINAVTARVELYRGLTIQFNVDAATFIPITIVVWVKLIAQPTETQTQITANINAALTAYGFSLGFNTPFLYSKITETVYNADANIASIPSTNPPTLNSGTTDIAGTNLAVFATPTVTVNYL